MSTSYTYAESAAPAGAPLLIGFHGTGGNEDDFLGFARHLLPGAHLIAPRGDVSEGGALRFFRRAAEGVYDMADLARATEKMSAFIAGQVETLKPPMVGAVGYSNGANILASVMFEAPSLIDRAVLMHPLIPFDPPPQPALAGRRVLMTAGRRDPICPPALTERLAAYLAAQGADVETHWHEGGHEIRPEEVDIVQRFVSELID